MSAETVYHFLIITYSIILQYYQIVPYYEISLSDIFDLGSLVITKHKKI